MPAMLAEEGESGMGPEGRQAWVLMLVMLLWAVEEGEKGIGHAGDPHVS